MNITENHRYSTFPILFIFNYSYVSNEYPDKFFKYFSNLEKINFFYNCINMPINAYIMHCTNFQKYLEPNKKHSKQNFFHIISDYVVNIREELVSSQNSN